MRILQKISQHRRDFTAVYECEHCGNTVTKSGYDDAFFHQAVIPKMECPTCGKTAAESTPKTAPDVPAHIVI